MENLSNQNIKKILIIGIAFLVIFNFLIEAIVVSILMNSPSYQGVGILGLNFTLEGGDVFFFFYNFLVLSIIIIAYCAWKLHPVNFTLKTSGSPPKKVKVALIVLISFLVFGMMNLILRFYLHYLLNNGGMVILHFVLDLIYNVSIIISYAAFILTKYT